jgi:hypothetical protein
LRRVNCWFASTTLRRASLAIILNALTTERARLARLQALRDGTRDPPFPRDLAEDASIRGVLEGESRLTRLQLSSHADRKRELLERIERSRQEIRGLEEEQKSFSGRFEGIKRDLEDLMPLYERGYLRRPPITALQRELLRYQGRTNAQRCPLRGTSGMGARPERVGATGRAHLHCQAQREIGGVVEHAPGARLAR